MPEPAALAAHSAYSDPGPYAGLLRDLSDDVAALNATARNVIAHYRAELTDLAEDRRGEIDSRWLQTILATDQARHGTRLTEPRPLTERVAGCCRDHTLFVVGALREKGIPARSRVGFAGYFSPGYFHDHVIVEHHDGTRWLRTDPELDPAYAPFDPGDMAAGPEAPFQTAAEVWQDYRAGTVDPQNYGVFPGSEFAGPAFIRSYVIYQIAHRYGDEMLLWDDWGATNGGGDDAWIDELADLLVRADRGDADADDDLAARYAEDDRLKPGATVTQHSPYGEPSKTVRVGRL